MIHYGMKINFKKISPPPVPNFLPAATGSANFLRLRQRLAERVRQLTGFLTMRGVSQSYQATEPLVRLSSRSPTFGRLFASSSQSAAAAHQPPADVRDQLTQALCIRYKWDPQTQPPQPPQHPPS